MNASARCSAGKLLVLALSAGAITACLNINDPVVPPQSRYGAISIKSTNGPSATGIGTPVAIFFDAANAGIPDSRNQPDRCDFATLDSAPGELIGVLPAGPSLTMKIGQQDLTLPYDSDLKRYWTTSFYTYQLDDSVRVTVPGETNGFPASSINVKLAQPISPGSVTVPAADQAMSVTWNAVVDTTSAVVLSLRYANPVTSNFPNQQILCALSDDGAFQIPSSALGPFLASPNNKRSLVITRWRTRQSVLNATTLLHIVSSIDTLVTF